MKGVLVDTCVWSLAPRGKRPQGNALATQLSQIIDDNRAKMIGPIRQELLSGYSDKASYDKLRLKLQYFPNEPISDVDYECAAEYANLCRANGVQGSHTDFLICAVAVRLQLSIFTVDKDFTHYAKYLPVTLLALSEGSAG